MFRKNQTGLEIIRNIGFIAHIDAGKTTTTERILFYTGKTYKIGEVHEGTTVTDWMYQERERGITITSAATYCQWRNYQINIIDTPGHIDFTVEVERSLKVLDGTVVIFCGVGGVEPQSETVWRQAEKYQVPRIAFINKMDRIGADFFGTIEDMKEKLAIVMAPLQIPIVENDEFLGIIDLIHLKALYYEGEFGENVIKKEIPQNFQEISLKHRDYLMEKLAELDDSFMHKLIEGEAVSEQEVISAIRKYVVMNKFVPILCGAALKNKGIQQLLDAICDYLPSPQEAREISGVTKEGGEERIVKPEVSSPLCALCFKVFTDPFVGKLFYTRIYSGKIGLSSNIYNATKKKKNELLRLYECMPVNRRQLARQKLVISFV